MIRHLSCRTAAEGNIILSDLSLFNAHLNGFVLTLGKSINAKWKELFFGFLNKHLVCMYMYSEKNTYSVYKYKNLTKEE